MKSMLQGNAFENLCKENVFRGCCEDIKYLLLKYEMLECINGYYQLTSKGMYVAQHGGIIRIYYKNQLMIYLQILGSISAIIAAVIAIYSLI